MIFHPAREKAFMGELKPNINIVNCGGSRLGRLRTGEKWRSKARSA
jgi:hypothetical protein